MNTIIKIIIKLTTKLFTRLPKYVICNISNTIHKSICNTLKITIYNKLLIINFRLSMPNSMAQYTKTIGYTNMLISVANFPSAIDCKRIISIVITIILLILKQNFFPYKACTHNKIDKISNKKPIRCIIYFQLYPLLLRYVCIITILHASLMFTKKLPHSFACAAA